MKPRLWEIGVFVLCLSLAGSAVFITFWVRPALQQTGWAAQRVNDNLVVLGPRSQQITRDTMELLNDLKATAKASREEWESKPYQLGRQRYFQASDYLIRVLNQADEQALPEVIAAVGDVRMATQALADFLKNFDKEVNGALLPQTTTLIMNLADTAKALNTDIATTVKAIERVATETELTIRDVREIVASPEWLQILKNVEASSKNVETTTKSISEAAAETPSMARSVEKILSTTSKYQKALLLFQILGTAVNILKPF